MGVINYKTWYDLWQNKGRTLQVVLIIAIGAFAIGTTMGASELISKDIGNMWHSTNPPMIGFWTDPAVDDAIIESLEDLEGVATVEGQMQTGVKWRLSPDDPWQTTQLIARNDYDEQKISVLKLDSGHWPHRKIMAVERGYNFAPGDKVYLEVEEKEYAVEIGGVVYSTMVAPASFGGSPTFYTTRERFGQLTQEPNFNRIMATLPQYTPPKATQIADRMQAHLEKQDFEVGAALPNDNRTTPPDEHFIQEDLDGVFFLLTSLAVVSLVLGLFLVYNTITAIVSQQVNQIGMMKAVGATFWQILWVYFSQVFIYALLALLLAVPLGAFGAHGVRVLLINLFNMEPGPMELLPRIILIQAAVALLSPLVVAVMPILSGARITVQEAVSTYGLGGTAGLLDNLLARAQNIPRTLALTIGNTFRNKWRVFFTQITLVGSGLVFMMVMNTQASLLYTYGDVIFTTFDANVFLSLDDDERIEAIEKIALAHPGVTAVEMWGYAGGSLRLKSQPETNDDPLVDVRGLPVPTKTYVPQMRAGRWLRADDTYAMVLNQEVAQKLGVEPGDWVTLDIPNKRESHWQVVGLLFEVFNEDAVHVPRRTLLRELGQVGRAGIVRVQTVAQDPAGEEAVAADLRTFFEANDYTLQASSWDTSHELTDEILSGGISIVTTMLAAMAVVIAIVGAIALSGALSINVLERRREIGVMRAIGASSLQIFRLFIGEGLLLGWLSWLIALPLSIPAGLLLTTGLSSIMGGELSYNYSPAGMLYWLAIITVLSVVASILPAQGATRISVQESLAYQ